MHLTLKHETRYSTKGFEDVNTEGDMLGNIYVGR